MADNLSSLTIIIVTYNSATEIGPCLDSLVGHTAPFPTTITVVDNASTDGTAELVRQRWPEVQVFESPTNVGFSRANNLGIRATTSDYVLLMNPDTVAPPGAIQTLVRGLAAHPEAAIAGARLLSDRGFPELSWGEPIGPWNELKRKMFSILYYRKVRRIVRKVDKLSRQAREVAWVSGACMVIRRPDLEAVGLLDERYFMYTEDVDLCVAMARRGRTVLYVAGAEVLHHRGKSAARNPETERLYRQSQLAYYEKHLPRWAGVLRVYLKLTGKTAGH
ncbi:MAG: glycosyltransferase family 2 protein [Acidobacteriota bacterium]|nr:glycosyltransferase family 2 protein [Acidobacteriota bacterium]